MAKKVTLDQLSNHLPSGTERTIFKWINELKVDFTISKPRKTKLGDFRPPFRQKPARITVNEDLNQYHFLITTVHEFAHLGCYLKHKDSVLPHGQEWKSIYQKLLKKFIDSNVFPNDLLPALSRHLSNTKASSCSDSRLIEALNAFDDQPKTFLKQVPMNTEFKLGNHLFRVEAKRKTRYLCVRLNDNKKYLVSGSAAIEINAQY